MDLRVRKEGNKLGKSISKSTKVFNTRKEAEPYRAWLRSYVFDVMQIVDKKEVFYGYGVPK